MELFAAQVFHRRLTNLIEVVGQHTARQSYGDAVGALGQEQRILYRQGDGFLVSAIVAKLPLGGLGIEHRFEGKFREARLDVSGSGRRVAGEDVSPVSLGVDEQVFLSELYQSVVDGCVAVWVKLHGFAHDVGHLVVAPVVHTLHGVQYAALHRLQSVATVWHGTLQDNIRGVVQEPVLVHARQVVHGRCVEAVGGLVVAVGVGSQLVVGLRSIVVVDDLVVVHICWFVTPIWG